MLTLLLAMQAILSLPASIRADLDASCAGWRLAPVTAEIQAEIASRTPSWPANLIPGDFNGDGETDAAALIECKGAVQLYVFVAAPAGFPTVILEKPQQVDSREFLHLIRGEYDHDAIGVEYDAIGGHAWVFKDGKWQSIAR
jgi:hypothetical protein